MFNRRRRPLREQQHRAWLDGPPRRRPRRIFGRQRLDLRMPIGVLAALTVLVGLYGSGMTVFGLASNCEQARIATCYDGDTCDAYIEGRRQSVRLIGFDTPELNHNARCTREQGLGLAARNRLTTLIAQARDKEFCTGGPSYERDDYGRVLAVLRLDGNDVGPIMISEGHAVPYPMGYPPDWCL